MLWILLPSESWSCCVPNFCLTQLLWIVVCLTRNQANTTSPPFLFGRIRLFTRDVKCIYRKIWWRTHFFSSPGTRSVGFTQHFASLCHCQQQISKTSLLLSNFFFFQCYTLSVWLKKSCSQQFYQSVNNITDDLNSISQHQSYCSAPQCKACHLCNSDPVYNCLSETCLMTAVNIAADSC